MISTILTVVLVVMIGLSLLALIAGLIKGIYKTSVKTLIEVILIVVFIFLTPTIADAVGNIDLSNFNYSFDLNINGTITTISLTTIQQTLADIITATGVISPMNGISVYETAIALATSLLSYALFLVEILLVQLLIWLITAIVYNGIFRWFLPVESRSEAKRRRKSKNEVTLSAGIIDEDGNIVPEEEQKKKLRRHSIGGGILGACGEFCLTVILISPITSLADIVIDNRETISSLSYLFPDSISENLDEYLDEIEDSAIMKIAGVGGLDSAIMDQASRVEVNGETVSLNGLLSSVLDIASPLISSGAISFEDGVNSITINYPILLNSSMVDEVLSAVINNPMVIALIPPIIDAAMNTLLAGTAAIDDLDFTDIDWTDELSIINSFYSEIYSTGIVSTFIDDDGTSLSLDNFSIQTSTMSDDVIETYVEAVSTLGESEIIKKNMPILLSGLASYLASSGYDIMPTEASAYEDVDWSHDLGLLVGEVLRICRLIGVDIDKDIAEVDFSDRILEIFKDEESRDLLEIYLIGAEDDASSEGLLDMQVLEPLDLTEVMISVIENISAIQKYIDGIDLSEVLSGFDVDQFQSELSVYFDACDNIFGENSVFVEDDFSFDDLDWGDPQVATQLYEVIDIMEDSEVFMSLYAPTIKTFLYNNDNLDIDTYLFGLTPYDFNYDSDDFLDNFKEILLLVPEIKEMTDAFSDSSLSLADQLRAIDTDTIRKLLNIVANSDFFNSPKDTGTTGSSITNANIYTVLKNLFEVDAIADLGIYVPSLQTISHITWGDGFDGGEIDTICKVLDDAIANADFLSSGEFDLDKLNDSQKIADMINDGLDSDILSPCILQIINDSLNEYLNDLGIPVSFEDMRISMWKEDADDIAKLLDLLRGLDLDDLDFDSIDPERLNAIITLLSQTNFANAGGNNFGYLVYSLLSYQNFFDEIGIEASGVYEYFLNAEWTTDTALVTITVPTNSGGLSLEIDVTTSGEIKDLCEFLSILQSDDSWFDDISEGRLPSSLVDRILASDIFESTIIRGVFAQVLNNSAAQLDLGSSYQSVFDSVDFSILNDMSSDEIKAEISLFSRLYELNESGELESIFDHIFDLTEEQLGTLQSLLSGFGSSRLLTTTIPGQTLSPLGRILYITILDNDLAAHITLSENTSEQESVLMALISSVTDWIDETDKLSQIITYLQGFDIDDLSIVDITDAQVSNLEAALHAANGSKIFHRLTSSILSEGFEDYDIAEILTNPQDGEITHTLDFHVNLGTSVGEIAYWDDEILYACEIFALVRDYFRSDENATFDDLVIGGDGENSVHASILAYFGKMKLFENSRSLITYNLLNNSLERLAEGFQLSSLFMPEDMRGPTPYLEDSDGYRFEELLYSDAKLVDREGEFDLVKGLNDLNLFDDFFKNLIDIINDLVNSSEEASHDGFTSLTHDVFIYSSDADIYRSDLSSELTAGVISLLFSDLFPAHEDFDILFEDDYLLVNPVEGTAIDALFYFIDQNLAETISTEDLISLFESFSLESSDDELIDHFLNESPYSDTHNSLLMLEILDDLADRISVQVSGDSEMMTLSEYLESTAQYDHLKCNEISFRDIDLSSVEYAQWNI